MELYLKTTSDVKCLSKDVDQNLGWYLSLSAEHFFGKMSVVFSSLAAFILQGSFHGCDTPAASPLFHIPF